MWCVVLQPKGTSRNAQIPANTATHSPALIGTILRRATPPEYVGLWNWAGMVVHLYAYKTGKAGTENKHELPPPHDTILLFGEAVLIAAKGPSLVSFTTGEYTKFYNEILGGFDDIGSEDSDTEDEVSESEEELEEEESASESEAELIEEEEEEVRPVKVTKVKRATKKITTWYTIPELVPESYDAPRTDHMLRDVTRHVVKERCAFLSEAERDDLERGIFNHSLEEAKRRGARRVWENPVFQKVYDIVYLRKISNLYCI
jgi:hypothetical protein